MNITLLRKSLPTVEAQWLVVGVFESQSEPPPGLDGTAVGAMVSRLRAEKEVTGSLGELVPLFEPPGLAARALLLVGLGPRGRFDSGPAFAAGFTAAKRLAGKARETVALALPEIGQTGSIASALIEASIVGTQNSGLRKTEPNRHLFGTLSLVVEPELGEDIIDELESGLRRGEIVGEAINLARQLANTPPSAKPPARLADRIASIAGEAGIAVETWDPARIRNERFGGLLGVAAGSDEPPSFLTLDYQRGGSAPRLALVGKGVTFDSGGLCLKTPSSMEDMKSDMSGAAIVAATMQAVARLALPVNVTGYLALTENMTGGKAMKLGDVLTLRSGKTVEVMNTDAEGRLILADALCYAAESAPHRLLDLATLTGACMTALGTKVAGLFSNDDSFCEDFLLACRVTGERAWRMPLDEDYLEGLKSHVADLKNIGGKWGGAITAAKFLEQFVKDIPWIHLDIAGPSWNDSDSAARDVGATGCFVRSLVRLLERAGAQSEPAEPPGDARATRSQ
jgi:leucyl aminopeptidase